LVFCAEVVLAATGTVEKQVGVVMLVMDFGWPADVTVLDPSCDFPDSTGTADETVLDPSCDFPDFRLDLENDGRVTLLFELFAVLTTGTVTKPVGLNMTRLLVTVATGTLEEPVRDHLVRVSVTVARAVEDSLGVSGMTEDGAGGGACSDEGGGGGGGDGGLGGGAGSDEVGGGGGDEELGGGATTETLVETTTEVEGTTEVDATTAVDVSTFGLRFLEAKSTLALASPGVILPLR
jgi:hypothetical protein